ncbi:MAG: PEP-utilizing enzyme, partial [Candidatus Saccharibacteria bacterium]|nr:PEP-utilizing enzyme [Candidatus Saccharibacteria bacterium]
IERPRDIFFLEKDEITAIIRRQKYSEEEIKEKIAKRKLEYEENDKKPTNERMYFYGDIKEENMLPIYSRQETQLNTSVLSGVAGGGEIKTGVVKLVESPDNADVKGYILMAKRTDPGWTVLFPMAEAIIIERGSILSHSAVVARELGITLVVGVRGLTDRVKDGDTVKVDGKNGTIEIIKRAKDEQTN